jgi:hypothetical protein
MIPDGGGWRARGRTHANHQAGVDKTPIGYDYLHSLVDDHSRLAWAHPRSASVRGADGAAYRPLRACPHRPDRALLRCCCTHSAADAVGDLSSPAAGNL